MRTEIVTDGDYIWWTGDGTKSIDNPGIFSIRNDGSAYFGGSLSSGVVYASSTCSILGEGSAAGLARASVTGVPTAGNVKQIVASISYSNVGTTTASVGTTISGRLTLERAIGGGSGVWTQLTRDTFTGSVISSGNNYNIRVDGSFTYTDQTPSTSNWAYRVTLDDISGPWPITLSGNLGRQRLTIALTEQ